MRDAHQRAEIEACSQAEALGYTLPGEEVLAGIMEAQADHGSRPDPWTVMLSSGQVVQGYRWPDEEMIFLHAPYVQHPTGARLPDRWRQIEEDEFFLLVRSPVAGAMQLGHVPPPENPDPDLRYQREPIKHKGPHACDVCGRSRPHSHPVLTCRQCLVSGDEDAMALHRCIGVTTGLPPVPPIEEQARELFEGGAA